MASTTEQQPVPSASRAARLGTLGAAMALGGCMSLAPVHQTPEAPVAGQFAYASHTGSNTRLPAAIDIPWQQFFVDSRLQQLIRIALENNRDLRLATLNIERASAQYNIQRAERLPGINAIGRGERAPSPLNGEQSSSYTVGLGMAAFELDFFGRVRELSKAALANYLGTEQARRTAQISLVAAVANTYLMLRSLDEQLSLTRQTLKTREESRELTQLQFRNGTASSLDASQADALVHAAQATLAALSRQFATTQNALALLLGQPLPPESAATGVSTAQGLPEDPELVAMTELPAGVPAETLVRRPDILQAEQQLRAANANIGAARAAFFPRITLTGTAGVASTELSALFNHGQFAWTLSPQLVLPIFDAGRNRANLRMAETDRKIAIASYEKAIQTAFREVSDALANRQGLLDQLKAQQALVRAEQERLDMANLRYRNGVSSYFDVLDAQRSSFAARQELIAVRTAQRQNLVELYKVLGGGWQ